MTRSDTPTAPARTTPSGRPDRSDRTNRSGAGRDLVRPPGSDGAAGAPPDLEPRWSALWRQLAAARAELAEHERRAGAIETLFRTTIEPRERLLTLGVARVTGVLIDRYDTSSLERGERSVLGLWINENLESLAGHPYAPAVQVAALVERWRGVLDAAGDAPADPADPASTAYRTMPVSVPEPERAALERDAISRYLGALFERGSRVRELGAEREGGRDAGPCEDAVRRSDAGSRDARRRPGAGAADDAGGAGEPAPGAGGASVRDGAASSGARGDARPGTGRAAPGAASDPAFDLDVDAGMRALIERLFRRLARALHPDREQDPAARDVKHVLMSTALAARRARDLDTLLSLHAEHVGALPDALGPADGTVLVRALERQLEGMRRLLRRARDGDPFRADLLSRYEGADDAARGRRVVAHAARLDGETARLERLTASLATPDGLEDALDDRRELERDRLSIDELTGG